jgi:multicomponent Na+:H+ antiporter subunit B
MADYSQLFRKTVGVLYPFIIIFGLYVIVNGHNTPGGGFQGGAILAACFIVDYLVNFEKTISLSLLTKIEKYLYLGIISFAIICVLYLNLELSFEMKQLYLILMNVLIGFKVCCGLTVIFFRFILFESR